jgi:hypothetical protein
MNRTPRHFITKGMVLRCCVPSNTLSVIEARRPTQGNYSSTCTYRNEEILRRLRSRNYLTAVVIMTSSLNERGRSIAQNTAWNFFQNPSELIRLQQIGRSVCDMLTGQFDTAAKGHA